MLCLRQLIEDGSITLQLVQDKKAFEANMRFDGSIGCTKNNDGGFKKGGGFWRFGSAPFTYCIVLIKV